MIRPNRFADGTMYLCRPFNKTHCSVVKESWIFFRKIVHLIWNYIKQKSYLILRYGTCDFDHTKWCIQQIPVTKPFVQAVLSISFRASCRYRDM
jgi:hypothetical protein